jgi:hypothetical protein
MSPLPDAAPRVERLRLLKAEVDMDLCSHGVAPSLCIDHKRSKATETTPTDHRTPSTTPDPTQGDAS